MTGRHLSNLYRLYSDYLFKLILLGDANVGKSSILIQYTEEVFSARSCNIGIDFVQTTQKLQTIELDEKQVKLQIWDTAGTERFRDISSQYYRGIHGAILVFDVTDRVTFHRAEYWAGETDRYAQGIPRILVGNKCDLADTRAVETEEGRELARQLGAAYIETSAKTGHSVGQLFRCFAGEVKSWVGHQAEKWLAVTINDRRGAQQGDTSSYTVS